MLEVTDLVAGYDGRAVAKLPALKVERGATTLLLGPSGSGKTTLMLAIAGLAEIQAGAVTIEGENYAKLSAIERDRRRGRRIGLVLQDLHLVPGLTALDNVLLAPFAAGVAQDAKRARELLGSLGLGNKASQAADRLSRGEAQRTAIARAMLLEPALILADEPTSSLDDPTCAAVAALLTGAAQETGAALVIATHDQRLKARFPSVVAVEPVP
jgi:putative ABC transport system ATP-binding protein